MRSSPLPKHHLNNLQEEGTKHYFFRPIRTRTSSSRPCSSCFLQPDFDSGGQPVNRPERTSPRSSAKKCEGTIAISSQL